MAGYFNSIKVRLERTVVSVKASFQLFQFHKGAIRTQVLQTEFTRPFHYFNSIKVRLELWKAIRGAAPITHFNSIKVRLEPAYDIFTFYPYIISIP